MDVNKIFLYWYCDILVQKQEALVSASCFICYRLEITHELWIPAGAS